MYLLEPMSAEPIASLFKSADQPHPQTQLRKVWDCCGDADDAGKQWSSQDEWPRLLTLNKPALIRCQAEQPNYIISATDCLSVSKPLESVARLGDGGTDFCWSVITSPIATKEVSILVHSLWLPQTCYGVLHVMNTHTHRPIHSVTVVLSIARQSVWLLPDPQS